MKYIYGLNVSGQSIIKYFFSKEINFIAWDDNQQKRSEIIKKYNNIKLIHPNDLDWSLISETFVSPGIDLNISALSKSRELKKPLYRDLELYSQISDNNKIIAVTGTNGKSTTVQLIRTLLELSDLDSYVCGNLAPPLMDFYNENVLSKIHIIELSSYQLESAPSFRPFISILLNISDDHQDRYGNILNYAKIKEKIFSIRKPEYGIISADDIYCKEIFNNINDETVNLIPVSIKQKLSKGVSLLENKIYDNFFDNTSYLICEKNFSLSGNFNNQNILSAYVVSKILKIELNNFLLAIKTFKGLSHRLEKIYEDENCLIINNSKATNIESSVNSIKIYKDVFLILGGRLKNKDFSIYESVKDRVLKCFVIGESTEFIYERVSNYFQSSKCYTLSKAMNEIFQELSYVNFKITILMAPACSSFDQYKNFEERGNEYKKIVFKKFNDR